MFEKLINNKLYRIKKIGNGVTWIIDPTDVCSFLIEGTERALVIDTCIGMGNIRTIVEKICKLPYDVVLTHHHLDHVGGLYHFDKAFITQEDGKILRQEFEQSYQEAQDEIDEKVPFFIHMKIAAPNDTTKLEYIKDGDEFLLGGRTLRVICVPGHTKGSCVLLDVENRLLFTGDAANGRTLVMFDYSASVSEYYEALKRLKKMDDQYDKFYTAHSPFDVSKSCLDDLLEICDEIIGGKNEPIPYIFSGTEYHLAKKYIDGTCQREDGKIGNIVYK